MAAPQLAAAPQRAPLYTGRCATVGGAHGSGRRRGVAAGYGRRRGAPLAAKVRDLLLASDGFCWRTRALARALWRRARDGGLTLSKGCHCARPAPLSVPASRVTLTPGRARVCASPAARLQGSRRQGLLALSAVSAAAFQDVDPSAAREAAEGGAAGGGQQREALPVDVPPLVVQSHGRRTVAIGDLHGDWPQVRAPLGGRGGREG